MGILAASRIGKANAESLSSFTSTYIGVMIIYRAQHESITLQDEQSGLINRKSVVCSGDHILSADGFCVLAGHTGKPKSSAGLSVIPAAHTSEEAPACMRHAVAMVAL